MPSASTVTSVDASLDRKVRLCVVAAVRIGFLPAVNCDRSPGCVEALRLSFTFLSATVKAA